MYAPTAPESLPGRERAAFASRSMRAPSRLTYADIAKPKVIGSAKRPCVRPICGVSASASASAMARAMSRASAGTMTRSTVSR